MAHLTKKLKNEKEIRDCLKQLISDMDAAIAQAVENPLLFLDGPFLNAIEVRCASLADIEYQREAAEVSAPPHAAAVLSPGTDATLTALVWEVRRRAGRLQRLLDSASQFYSACFSPRTAECLDYGVHGEWGRVVSPTHLVIDC